MAASSLSSVATSTDCVATRSFNTHPIALVSSLKGLPIRNVAPLQTTILQRTQLIIAKTKHYLVEKVSAAELSKLLEGERNKSIVIDFYAAWCGPCVILAQEIERLAVEFGHKVRFVKIDTGDEYEFAHRMQVRGLPTVIFVSKDPEKNVIRAEGILPREAYRNIILNNL